jgi:ADP-heptose:LPS heptosyltransferase
MSELSKNTGHRVLIYRLGSLGDTVVAIPALRLVARAFPDSERWMLTNFSISSKAAPMSQLLEGMGLVHGFISYPIGVRNIAKLARLIARIRALGAEALVYMAAPRGRLRAWRDALFFKVCGIRRLIGVPYTRDLQNVRQLRGGMYEYEGSRLARCLAELGDAGLRDPASFDLELSSQEIATAETILVGFPDGRPILAAGVGGKVDVNDWGDGNWGRLLERLSQEARDWSLVMLGSADERERCEHLLKHWNGNSRNLCGTIPVRVSAAVLARCRLFVGHDSGPMHLAAAVGTPCVAVFSSRNLPGEWFPHGSQHRVIYHPIDCQGCHLEVCALRNKECIRSISVEEVLHEALDVIEATK